jgi:hypothetical protein
MKKGSESDSSSAWLAATPLYFKQTASSIHNEKEIRDGFWNELSNEIKGVTYWQTQTYTRSSVEELALAISFWQWHFTCDFIAPFIYSCIPAGRAVITSCSRWLVTSEHCRISKCKVVPLHDMQAYGVNGNRTPLNLSCWWSGPGAKAPVALQPLDLPYALFYRSSNCRRQMSPRPTRRERSKQREVEL